MDYTDIFLKKIYRWPKNTLKIWSILLFIREMQMKTTTEQTDSQI